MRALLRAATLVGALLACCRGFQQPLGVNTVHRGERNAFSSKAVSRSSVLRLDTEEDDDVLADLNWLHTRLQFALDQEDYAEAANVRDRIRRCADIGGAGMATEAAWTNLGVPDWLADRLERLNFPLPTRVQLHSLRAAERGDDSAICAPTGSGKTLSYLLPLLTQLSDDLLSEDLSNYLAGFLDGGRSRGNAKGAERRRAAAQNATGGESALTEMAVPTPAVLIVVPTRELGVQVSMLCYRLLGGGTTNPTLQPYSHPSRYVAGGKANMFSYQGPRNVKVAGLWDEQGLTAGAAPDGTLDPNLLKGVHIVVGTPEYLSRVAVGGKLKLQNVRNIVIDEADMCLTEPANAEAMDVLLRRMAEMREESSMPTPQTLLAGASLSPKMIRRAIDDGWVRAPALVSEFGWTDVEIESAESSLAAGARSIVSAQRVPAGAAHEYVVAEPKAAVATLCRILRERFEAVNSETEPPRVVVFAPSADSAVKLASRLQGALFGSFSGDASAGLWGLSVLLPSAESRLETTLDSDTNTLNVLESSLRVMEMFACNRTSVLVTTAAATRGLDFPQVTDVLNLGIVGSAADYVHRAGRVGRVGQLARGNVLSVLCAAEVDELLALGRELSFSPCERKPPDVVALSEVVRFTDDDDEKPTVAGVKNEDAVQVLADIYNLLDTTEPDFDADGQQL